ncbi:MAG: phenylalanine--tRNA ligase subunit beta [Spirochaetales bacterium]|jgi:phenylalanyl-tRNA synthetase beta chain|nr:phenylalanine--tRNA ligase subunit beta [Spirochaetales bacterium]
MPKIEVNEKRFYSLIGRSFSHAELEDILPAAKGELDTADAGEGLLKLELNDTNRPDLWSTAGLARQLRIYMGGPIPEYDFFSRAENGAGNIAGDSAENGAGNVAGNVKDSGTRRIIVDPALKDIRPWIAAFAVKGKKIDELTLTDIIQSQEKLCWNYGRRRKSIAMGIYRSGLISWPVHYDAVDPEKTSFQPLGSGSVMNLRQINREHPKGIEFGHITEGFAKFPFLRDNNAEVLSYPPVINSSRIGAVEPGDEDLFVELTGTEIHSLLHALSIVACDFADLGFTILPVKVCYPYDTPYGREITTPFYFQTPQEAKLADAAKILGEVFSPDEALRCLRRMGCRAEARAETVRVNPPEYRNDFLHAVDIIEDIMIGKGMDHFKPVRPQEFTVGRLSDAELFARKTIPVMVGMGFQEMIFNYLGAGRNFIEKMNMTEKDIIRISNPMSENYEFVRNSILPCLLEAESVSANSVYPHNMFEIGKTARLEPSENYGTLTLNTLGFLSASTDTDFNTMKAQVAAVLYYLSAAYTLAETDDPRFIPGRCARILIDGKDAGIFGEIHPAVLENWGIQIPCSAAEIFLDMVK